MASQRLVFDQVAPLRWLLLTVPAVFCVGAFAAWRYLSVQSWLFGVALLSCLVPLLRFATIVDRQRQELRVVAGLVFLSVTRFRAPLQSVVSLQQRCWNVKGSYQSSTGNYIPTMTTYYELALRLKGRDTPVVLVALDNAAKAERERLVLTEVFGLVSTPLKRGEPHLGDGEVSTWARA